MRLSQEVSPEHIINPSSQIMASHIEVLIRTSHSSSLAKLMTVVLSEELINPCIPVLSTWMVPTSESLCDSHTLIGTTLNVRSWNRYISAVPPYLAEIQGCVPNVRTIVSPLITWFRDHLKHNEQKTKDGYTLVVAIWSFHADSWPLHFHLVSLL